MKTTKRIIATFLVALMLIIAAPLSGFVLPELPSVSLGWLKASATDMGLYDSCATNHTCVLDSNGVTGIGADASEIKVNCINDAGEMAIGYGADTEVNEQEEHHYVTKIIKPTCTQDGYTLHSCEICFDTYTTDQTDALGHEWSRGNATTLPACTLEGVLEFRCTRQGCKAIKTEPIAPINHVNAYELTAVEPTCTNEGYTAGTYCPDCGLWLSGHDAVEALAHSPSAWIIDKCATCTATGSQHKECTVCHEVLETKEPAVLNHGDADSDGNCDACGTDMGIANCPCNCHKTGFIKFFFKFILFIPKIFGLNKTCACGVAHY